MNGSTQPALQPVVAADQPAPPARPTSSYGVVAIGRNEGDRLRRCLESLDPKQTPLVYVDSGSTDGSVAMAESLGALVVRLDMTVPFTAARARNEGYRRLLEIDPTIEFLQFVDGDCEVVAEWPRTALQFLKERPDVVAVCGRRNERFPEHSVYNALCEMDWQGPVGEVRAFGGDVVLRASALCAVGGYNPDLIAGEEPELCIRLRRAGWKIWHLDVGMTLHDANMLRFSQWWRRGVRTGYAFAQGSAMYGAPPERHWVRETRSACFWGLGVPALALLSIGQSVWLSLAFLVLYPIQVARIYLNSGFADRRLARLKAAFLVLGKFAEASGVFKFTLLRLQGRQARLIEYK